MKYKLNQKVYHKSVYDGKELLKIVGIRETELELEGDYSGGTHAVLQKDWMPIDGVIMYTKIVAAFPGCGKTHYCNYDSDYMPDGFAMDSDSSKFHKSTFPQNYIDHIESHIGKVKIIFCSTHKCVREELLQRHIPFVLAYPGISLKYEYLQRFVNRGSSAEFIKTIERNWDQWIEELQNQKGCEHLVLKFGQYLNQVV
jgi:hypothetical protein